MSGRMVSLLTFGWLPGVPLLQGGGGQQARNVIMTDGEAGEIGWAKVRPSQIHVSGSQIRVSGVCEGVQRTYELA